MESFDIIYGPVSEGGRKVWDFVLMGTHYRGGVEDLVDIGLKSGYPVGHLELMIESCVPVA